MAPRRSSEIATTANAHLLAPTAALPHSPGGAARVATRAPHASKEQPGGLSILGPWFPSRGDRAKARLAEKAERDGGGRHGPARTGSAVTRRARSSPRAGAAPFRSATPPSRWPAEASGRGLRAVPRPRRRGRARPRAGGGTGAGLLPGVARRAVTRWLGTRRWSATAPR